MHVRMQEFEAAREDIKNKNTEDLNVMKITLESTIDELEKKFEVSHEAYLMQTGEHMATFNALTKTDAQAARVIDMRMRKLQRLQVRMQHRCACAAAPAGARSISRRALQRYRCTRRPPFCMHDARPAATAAAAPAMQLATRRWDHGLPRCGRCQRSARFIAGLGSCIVHDMRAGV
jgi:hypothetical protein